MGDNEHGISTNQVDDRGTNESWKKYRDGWAQRNRLMTMSS
jgi:hypothetical protein